MTKSTTRTPLSEVFPVGETVNARDGRTFFICAHLLEYWADGQPVRGIYVKEAGMGLNDPELVSGERSLRERFPDAFIQFDNVTRLCGEKVDGRILLSRAWLESQRELSYESARAIGFTEQDFEVSKAETSLILELCERVAALEAK